MTRINKLLIPLMLDMELFMARVRANLMSYKERLMLNKNLTALRRNNKLSQKILTDENGPVVSLTTHGDRLYSVFIVIESIGQGALRPSRLILWLDKQEAIDNLPKELLRLKTRGLEIMLSDNYGPHTKYFPYIASISNHKIPLVTCDDDIIYPTNWLKDLMCAHKKNNTSIYCHRAHIIKTTSDGDIYPYAQWLPCRTKSDDFSVFATGVSGIIYPAHYLNFVRSHGTGFMQCCPRADDVWLHALALRGNFHVRQLRRLPVHFATIPNTQHLGLINSNIGIGGNDIQIAATYTKLDRKKLTAAKFGRN